MKHIVCLATLLAACVTTSFAVEPAAKAKPTKDPVLEGRAAAKAAELPSQRSARKMGDAIDATVGAVIVLPAAAVIIPAATATDAVYQGVKTTGNTVKEFVRGDRTLNPLKSGDEFRLVEPCVDGKAYRANPKK